MRLVKIKGIISNNRGSGAAFVIFGIVVILFIVITMSSMLHNTILVSKQMMIKQVIETGVKAAMRCIDIYDLDNLERISRGESAHEYNYISLDIQQAYDRFIKTISLGLIQDESFMRNKTVLIFIEPKSDNLYNIKLAYGDTFLDLSDRIASTTIELEDIINSELRRIAHDHMLQESGEDKYKHRIDISVLLQETYYYEDVFAESVKDSVLIAVLYDYEIDGIFPIISKLEGVTTKHRFYTAMYSAVSHIRRIVEEK